MLKELIRNATMRLVEILTGFIDSLETWLDEYFGVTLDGLDLSDLENIDDLVEDVEAERDDYEKWLKEHSALVGESNE